MIFRKTLIAAFVAGMASLPMQSAQAWWGGGPGYGGSDWGPFDGDGWGDFNMSMSGGGRGHGYGRGYGYGYGYPYYGYGYGSPGIEPYGYAFPGRSRPDAGFEFERRVARPDGPPWGRRPVVGQETK